MHVINEKEDDFLTVLESSFRTSIPNYDNGEDDIRYHAEQTTWFEELPRQLNFCLLRLNKKNVKTTHRLEIPVKFFVDQFLYKNREAVTQEKK